MPLLRITSLALVLIGGEHCGSAPQAEDRADRIPQSLVVRPSSGPNEPAGHVPVTRRQFVSNERLPGWSDGPSGKIVYVLDSTAVESPPGVARMLFHSGWRSGVAPAHAEYRFPVDQRFRQIYLSYWFKVSANWYGHRVVSKIGYAWIGGRPMFYAGLIGSGSSPLRVQARLQDLAIFPSQGGNLNLLNRRGRVMRDTWHQLEVVLVANTPGRNDGEVRWWLDRRLVGIARDIGWVSDESAAVSWEGVSWRPIWGGAGGTVPEDQYMYMDDLYVSGLPE